MGSGDIRQCNRSSVQSAPLYRLPTVAREGPAKAGHDVSCPAKAGHYVSRSVRVHADRRRHLVLGAPFRGPGRPIGSFEALDQLLPHVLLDAEVHLIEISLRVRWGVTWNRRAVGTGRI